MVLTINTTDNGKPNYSTKRSPWDIDMPWQDVAKSSPSAYPTKTTTKSTTTKSTKTKSTKTKSTKTTAPKTTVPKAPTSRGSGTAGGSHTSSTGTNAATSNYGYGNGSKPSTGGALVTSPTTSNRVWTNPNPHILTRAPKIEWMPKSLTDTAYMRPSSSNPGTQTQVRGRLGRLYNTGLGLNGGENKWGVQFHYNPTSINLSASGFQDVALNMETLQSQLSNQTLIGVGSVSLSLELYFNRIFDMAYPSPTNYPSISTSYGPNKEDQLGMIRNLGTIYDIEYLYRISNGDPQATKYPGYQSSDTGVLLYKPAVLDLGPFKYQVVINGISVDHIMFTPDMVPTFSSVSISLTRIAGAGALDDLSVGQLVSDESTTAESAALTTQQAIDASSGTQAVAGGLTRRPGTYEAR